MSEPTRKPYGEAQCGADWGTVRSERVKQNERERAWNRLRVYVASLEARLVNQEAKFAARCEACIAGHNLAEEATHE